MALDSLASCTARVARLSPLAAGLVVALAATASAQPAYRAPSDGASVSLDVLTGLGDNVDAVLIDDQGNLVRDAQIRILSTVVLLSGRVPLGRRWTVVGEVPFSYFRARADLGRDLSDEDDPFANDDAQIGNPYLGAEVRVGAGLWVGAGVRLPLLQLGDPTESSAAAFAGIALDPERFEAHVSETAAVSALARYTHALTPSLQLRLGLAPAYLIDASDGPQRGENDLALGYQAHLDATLGQTVLSAGVLGRQTLTDNRYSFFEPVAAVALSVGVEVGGVRPGLQARIPLDSDDYFGTAAVVGLSLDVPIR